MKRKIRSSLIIISFIAINLISVINENTVKWKVINNPAYIYAEISDSIDVKTAKDDSLFYEADSLTYFVNLEQIELKYNAKIEYAGSTIQSDSIKIDFDREQAHATGRVLMQDGEQIIIGSQVYYDINTETGLVYQGASKFDLGFYYGDNMRKIDEEIYDVDYGRFTTCDAKDPHFDIRANKMRIYRNHMVVGKPIFFYVNEFPVLALPFAAFSIKKGRECGILTPEPGYNPSDGKYLKNIAFYCPINDYTDFTISADMMEKTGWAAEFDMPYRKRYDFSGRANALYRNRISSHTNVSDEWFLKAWHQQSFYDKSEFSMNLDFASSRQVWDNQVDVNKRLQETITSNISYRKPFSSSSLYLSGSYTEDLIKDTRSITLPTISYSLPSKPIYELFPIDSDSIRTKDYWWKNFTYSWRGFGTHTGYITEKHPTFADLFYLSTRDSTNKYINEHHAGLKQSIGVSWHNSFRGWLKMGQSINFDEALIDRDRNDEKLAHGYAYSYSSSASFSLYGMRRFYNSKVTAIRHIVTPSVSYSWKPDFSKQNKDLYSFGGVGVDASKKASSVGLNIEQKWQLKYLKGIKKEETKLNDLLVLRSGSNYNLRNKEKPWSDISHNLTFNPGTYDGDIKLSTTQSFSASQDAYDFNIKSWRVNLGAAISGDAVYNDYFPYEKNEFITRKFFEPDSISVQDQVVDSIQDLERLVKPGNWRFTADYDYSKARQNNYVYTGLRSSANLKLTMNWSFNYNNYMDMKTHKLTSQSISLVRELHCWRISFSYTKSADFWDYRIVLLNIKLPDALKLETHDYK